MSIGELILLITLILSFVQNKSPKVNNFRTSFKPRDSNITSFSFRHNP